MAVQDGNDARAGRLGVVFWATWVLALVVVIAGFLMGVFTVWRVHSPLAMSALVIAFTAALWALCFMPWLFKRRNGAVGKLRSPQKRYMLRFMPAMMAYSVILITAVTYYQINTPSGVLAWLIALAPVVPLLFAIRAIALLLKEEDDEFIRVRTIGDYVWATNFTLAACTAWGFLAMFKLLPHLDLWVVFPLWAAGLVPPRLISAWTKE